MPRLESDAVEYYAHLRSLYFDHDVEFTNEFAHFGILERGDKVRPTRTGHRRTIFSVGPALLWMPFYAAGDLVARAQGDVEEGYAPAHIRAVAFGSLVFTVAGLLLVARVLRTLVSPPLAAWAAFLLLYATFLYWYAVYEAVVSHAASFFVAALVLAVWWDHREALSLPRAVVMGLLIGFSATVRWQNGVLLLLPAFSMLRTLVPDTRRTVLAGVLTLVAFFAGAFPQMLAWKAVFGEYLLADPPHGSDFLRLDHPYLLETFFSSRHGLFFWTPILWAGYLGLLVLVRRDRFAALAAGVPLVLMTYVNACSGDWWAGGSFSNRRFDSVLPFLALGLALALDVLQRAVVRRPMAVLGAATLAFAGWNALFMRQYRDALIPRDDTVEFARVAENSAALVSETVGTPVAWPASWVFARRHRLSPAQWDLAAGKYLFYRQNNLGGVIDLGSNANDAALRGEGWSVGRPCAAEACRQIEGGRARLLAPLDVPEDLDVAVRAAGRGTLALRVNDRPVGAWPLEPDLRDLRVRVPSGLWHRELNELTFETGPSEEALVERVVFTRVAR